MKPEDWVHLYALAYGEQNRAVIAECLAWLDRREREWGLKGHVNRHDFISTILGQQAEGRKEAKKCVR